MPVLVPMTVIAGFLGAGKTTMLNHLLTVDHGRRVTVIVNDFGSLDIDAQLIESHDGETYALTNGCVCCSVGNDLGSTLLDIGALANRPEAIFFEASGVAEPSRFGAYANHRYGVELRGVIVVVDAETVLTRAVDRYVGDLVVRQLAAADLVAVNKVDLVDRNHVDRIRRWLPSIGATGTMVATEGGVLPNDLWLDDLHRRDRPPGPDERPEAVSPAADRFRSTVVIDAEQWGRARLAEALDQLPDSVVRVKGHVSLHGEVGRQLLQLVGRRWTLTPVDDDAPPIAGNELQLIAIADDTDIETAGNLLATAARWSAARSPVTGVNG